MTMTDFVARYHKHFNFKRFISEALREDVGDGDHTALSTIPKSHRGSMQLLVKEDGIIAGIEAAIRILKQVDKHCSIDRKSVV